MKYRPAGQEQTAKKCRDRLLNLHRLIAQVISLMVTVTYRTDVAGESARY
jgi:hypothetical protein